VAGPSVTFKLPWLPRVALPRNQFTWLEGPCRRSTEKVDRESGFVVPKNAREVTSTLRLAADQSWSVEGAVPVVRKIWDLRRSGRVGLVVAKVTVPPPSSAV